MNTISPLTLNPEIYFEDSSNTVDVTPNAEDQVYAFLEYLVLHNLQLADIEDNYGIYKRLFQLAGGEAEQGRGIPPLVRGELEKAYQEITYRLLPQAREMNANQGEPPMVPTEHQPDKTTPQPGKDNDVLLPSEFVPKPKKKE